MLDAFREPTQSETEDGARRPVIASHPHLYVLVECDRPLAGGARHALRGVDEVVLGRGHSRSVERVRARDEGGNDVNRLVLTLPAAAMSTSHARLVRRVGRWVFEDLGSTNGSRVNGFPIHRTVLEDGDWIEAGRTLLVLDREVPTPDGVDDDDDTSAKGDTPLGFSTLIPTIARELSSVEKIARSRVPVLVHGPTGTGKEVLARAIHEASERAGAFVAVNCGAIPAHLVESTLFGHTRGAFSGALRDEPGFVRAAHGGTLFLDEIGDMPHPAQAALLRVLQENEVIPVGTTRGISVDVRMIAASHRDLAALMGNGLFREDLYARLNGFAHTCPTLAERRLELGHILAPILRQLTVGRGAPPRLSLEAGRALFRYRWPRNVRELVQTLARACALAEDRRLEATDLPEEIRAALSAPAREPMADQSDLSDEDAALRAELIVLLGEHNGNVAQVARAFGKARMQVHRWMSRLGIRPDDYRRDR